MVAKALAPSRASRSRRPGRRQAILEAATRLFAERGFSGVSVQDIADDAGTHKTTVLYHFGTKEALYGTVLDEALERIAEVMRNFLAGGFDSESLRERVVYLLDQIQAYFAEHADHARLLERELLEVQASQAFLGHFVERIYLPALAGLEQAAAQGIIRPVDPAFFIHDLHVMLVGYFSHRALIERLRPVDPLSIDALIARRNHLVDVIFSLLRPFGAS